MKLLFLSRLWEANEMNSMGTGPMSPIKGALAYDPDLTIDFVVARNSPNVTLGHDRLNLIKAGGKHTGARELSMHLTGEIHDLVQDDSYDCIVSAHPGLTPLYRTLTDVPIVQFQLWLGVAKSLRWLGHFYCGETDVVMESSSALVAPNLWESKTMLEEAILTIRPYVSDEAIAWVRENSTVMPLGVDCDALDEVRKARLTNDQPRLFWGGTVSQAVKGWSTSRDVLARASLLSGADVLMTTMNDKQDEVPDQFESYFEVNRLGFYEQMKRGDVFVCNAGFESYGMAWLEMLGAGLLGVFQNAFWLKYVLPDWYPFIVDTPAQQAEVAAALIKQWPDGKLWSYSDRIAEYVAEEHNQHLGGKRMVDSIRKWTA